MNKELDPELEEFIEGMDGLNFIQMFNRFAERIAKHYEPFWQDEERLLTTVDVAFHENRDDLPGNEETRDDLKRLVIRMSNAEKVALFHSEISELLERFRKDPDAKDEHCPKFLNVEIEIADEIIRLIEFSVHRKYRIAEAVVAKHNYNLMRPHKHGKAF